MQKVLQLSNVTFKYGMATKDYMPNTISMVFTTFLGYIAGGFTGTKLIRQKEIIQKTSLTTDLSERKCNEKKKTLKIMEKDLKALPNTQKASFKVIHQKCLSQGYETSYNIVNVGIRSINSPFNSR